MTSLSCSLVEDYIPLANLNVFPSKSHPFSLFRRQMRYPSVLWPAQCKQVPVHVRRPLRPTASAAASREIAAPLDATYPYLIIGFGVAAQAALGALLEADPQARVLVVDADPAARGPDAAALPGGARVDFRAGVRVRRLDAPAGIAVLVGKVG
ncbi:unnamed protein product, partial [Phaeothamnion confervicola]